MLSCIDLNQAVPMLLDELDDIVRLVDLLEQWLRFDDEACDLLTDWRIAVSCYPGADASARGVIDALGTVSVKLHRILRAGIPDTGHTHPPTP